MYEGGCVSRVETGAQTPWMVPKEEGVSRSNYRHDVASGWLSTQQATEHKHCSVTQEGTSQGAVVVEP